MSTLGVLYGYVASAPRGVRSICQGHATRHRGGVAACGSRAKAACSKFPVSKRFALLAKTEKV